MNRIFFFFQSMINYNKNETLESKFESNRKIKHFYDNESSKKDHNYENGKPYVSGCSTYNVGIAQAILKTIDDASKFDFILFASDKFKDYKIVNKKVEKELEQFCVSKKCIQYSSDDDSDTILSTIFNDDQVKELLKEDTTVYIATNSGLRSNVMFFSSFSQILSYRKITTKLYYEEKDGHKITDSNVGDLVVDISENNKYYDILRGVELFTETGNPKKLISCYDASSNDKLKDLFLNMTKFYEKIQMCQRFENAKNNQKIQSSEKNDEERNKDHSLIDVFKSLRESIKKLDPKEDKLPVSLELILPQIKKSFFGKNLETEGMELIQILEWCVSNEIYTLGLFIFKVELMEFYIQKKIIKFKDDKLPEKKDIQNVIGSLYDEKFFNSYSSKNINSRSVEILVQSYILYISANKCNGDAETMKKFGFDVSNYEKTNKAILIFTLIRKMRNSIAHSSDYDILSEIIRRKEYRFNCLCSLIDEYGRDYQNTQQNTQDNREHMYTLKNTEDGSERIKTLPTECEDFYDICKVLMKKTLCDVKKLVSANQLHTWQK